MMLRRFALALLLILPLAACAQEDPKPIAYETDSLAIETRDGRRYEFTVELAITDEQQRNGLMFRESLADNAGMLFLHRRDAPRRMWMKNTLIPLDMLFIEANGRIESIARETVPESLEIVSSKGDVRAVLELRGGLTETLSISPGDRVIHPWLAE